MRENSFSFYKSGQTGSTKLKPGGIRAYDQL